MATSRDDLLKGADYEGYEAFCDTLINYLKNNWYMSDPRTNLTEAQDGMIAVDSDDGRIYYRHSGSWYLLDSEVVPKERGINLLFDSGSVEPQIGETLTGATSGAVGKVISVTVTSGSWGGGDAAGSIELGACDGRFNDNEDVNGSVGGANMLTVNQPDTAAGVDLIQNGEFESSTNGWTAGVGATLNSVAGGQVGNCLQVTCNGTANRYGYQNITGLTVGKIYKVVVYFKKGTASSGFIKIGTTENGTQYKSWTGLTDAAWTAYSHTFEATATNVYITLGSEEANNTALFDEVSLYEITPCCTEVDNKAMDGWFKDNDIDVYREHDGSNTKDGSFYALKVVNTGANKKIYWPNGSREYEDTFIKKFWNRTVAMGVWVKTNKANHVSLCYYDGGWHIDSNYHSGSGNWEWLELSHTFGVFDPLMPFGLNFAQTGEIGGDTIVYVSQPMLVFSAIIGEGNYQFRDNEVIWLEKAIPSNQLEAYTGQSSQGPTLLNLEADTDAMLPKGAKSIVVTSKANDSASLNNDTLLKLSKSAAAESVYYNDPSGKNNDKSNRVTGWQPLDEDGDYCFEIVASGAGTFDIEEFRYHAVQVTS